jgi:hypothetical protein
VKVLDLQCSAQHQFEGWFASEDEFQRQFQSELIACPVCGATSVSKRLSAPHLNLSSTRQVVPDTSESVVAPESTEQAKWMQALRQLVANTEDVGEKFPEEARKIHYGEAQQRSIRGQASATQTQELLEEGIQVLPLPQALKERLH